ncbi:MAG: VCBS repeat-containing protein, partial [Rubricoccaceae bacterium]|nr:VCBS repeat-containing protein [Rubricoccaceae bacterium]
MRNALHISNGDGTFSDVGQLAGISNTDWSWGPLLADFDLDGFKDLFVANGYRRDVTNLDYMQFTLDSLRNTRSEFESIDQLLSLIPSEPLPNYAYRNNGDLTFEDVSDVWGLSEPSFSNGAAYSDLDRDGDLDLVINELDGTAQLFRNESAEYYPDRSWLRVLFDGPDGNKFGLGAQVRIVDVSRDTPVPYASVQNVTTRGFYSAVEPTVHFGLGTTNGPVNVEVEWPDGNRQVIQLDTVNTSITAHYDDSSPADDSLNGERYVLLRPSNSDLQFHHQEDPFDDFKREHLLPHMHSREGPFMAEGDVDGDGLTDLYVGGAAGQPGQLFMQEDEGQFRRVDGPWSGADASREDTHALFFDANGDGALDLYVASGGSHVTSQSEQATEAFQDRLYFGDGAGGFTESPEGTLPPKAVPTGGLAAGDIDSDGDVDLFVGGRLVSGRWPEPAPSYVLRNDGGTFTDVTAELAADLSSAGLVTGASFADVTGDGNLELVLIGEWMAPQVWSVRDTGFERIAENGLSDYTGWWNSLTVADIDGDGDTDILGGNLGLNSRIRGSLDRPVRVYAKDYDSNGSIDPILTLYYPDGGEYPIHRRENLMKQLPYLQQRFPRYNRYASSTVDEVFRPNELEDALVVEAGWFATTWFENDGAGNFTAHTLPIEAQISPVFAAVVEDVDGDGVTDIILAGNNRAVDVERGPYDAGRGLLLRGSVGGGFQVVRGLESGLSLRGD